MSVDGSSHLGPDEAIKRENAERLLADVADVVLVLVGAHASKILEKILPHLPITLPPHFLDKLNLNGLAAVYGSMTDWATEALERAGEPQPGQSAGEAAPVYDFKRLNELDRQDVQALVALGNAWLAVGESARQLAAISPKSPAAQEQARRILGEAISQLIAASADLMQHADEWAGLHKEERAHIEATPPVHSPATAQTGFRHRLEQAEQRLKAAGQAIRSTGPAEDQTRRIVRPEAPNDSNRRVVPAGSGRKGRNIPADPRRGVPGEGDSHDREGPSREL